MKKSNIWTILVPALICAAILIGVFVRRISAGSTIHLEHTVATIPDSEDNDSHTDKKPPQSPVQKIDINKATPEILAVLPGIGNVLAQRIVNFRNTNGPFETVEDLLMVSGIGKKKLNDIIAYITVGGQK